MPTWPLLDGIVTLGVFYVVETQLGLSGVKNYSQRALCSVRRGLSLARFWRVLAGACVGALPFPATHGPLSKQAKVRWAAAPFRPLGPPRPSPCRWVIGGAVAVNNFTSRSPTKINKLPLTVSPSNPLSLES